MKQIVGLRVNGCASKGAWIWIISDFNLPGQINGMEVLTTFKNSSSSSDGTAILITAYVSMKCRVEPSPLRCLHRKTYPA